MLESLLAAPRRAAGVRGRATRSRSSRARLPRAAGLPPAGRGRRTSRSRSTRASSSRARRSTCSSSRPPRPTATARSASCSPARTRTAPPAWRAIKRSGGVAIVQDPETAERPDDAGRRDRGASAADAVLPLEEIAPAPRTGCALPRVSRPAPRTPARRRPAGEPARAGGDPRAARRRPRPRRVGRGGAAAPAPRGLRRDPARRADAGHGRLRDRELIKQRERTRHIPIIFLTAISKDAEHVFRGYEAGAVDYSIKPFDPRVLRSKVAVFIELWQKTIELQARRTQLLAEQELAALRARERGALPLSSPTRCRRSSGRRTPTADALLQRALVRATRGCGAASAGAAQAGRPSRTTWPRSREALGRRRAGPTPFEVEYRFRRADGAYRWHLGRAVCSATTRDDRGWVGTATDIEDRKLAEERQASSPRPAGCSAARSTTSRRSRDVARLAVPRVADWCAVDIFVDGRLAAARARARRPAQARARPRAGGAYPPMPLGGRRRDAHGEPVLVTEIDDARSHPSASTTPARDRAHARADVLRDRAAVRPRRGVRLDHARRRPSPAGVYGEEDAALAQELAGTPPRRSTTRGCTPSRAARPGGARARGRRRRRRPRRPRRRDPALEHGRRRRSPASPRRDVSAGRSTTSSLAGQRSRRGSRSRASRASPSAPRRVPVEFGGRELWISGSGVGFEEGTVYAFRDLTEERRSRR